MEGEVNLAQSESVQGCNFKVVGSNHITIQKKKVSMCGNLALLSLTSLRYSVVFIIFCGNSKGKAQAGIAFEIYLSV